VTIKNHWPTFFQTGHLLNEARTPKAALAKHVPSAAIEQRDAK
jgi:hypothetical protein